MSKRLRVVSTFTAEPIRAPLEFWSRKFDWGLELEFAPLNTVFQELLRADSGTLPRDLGATLVLLRWDDLVAGGGARSGNPGVVEAPEWPAAARRMARELISALRAAAQRSSRPYLVIFGNAGPPLTAPLVEGRPVRDHLQALEEEVAETFAEEPSVTIVPSSWIEEHYPVQRWRDPVGERAGQVPYTETYFAAVATATARRLHALQRSAVKVVVLDCDNTLWGGVAAEDGVDGVRIGEPFRQLQVFMQRQVEAGRLLCLCSRNREDDVRRVFEHRDDMVLRWDQIVAHRINWNDKARNLEELAGELNLGLDSFVFVDDNPIECASVAEALPQVLTLQLPSDPREIPVFLDHVWAFDVLRVTDADRRRNQMYRDNVKRSRVRREAPSLSHFLESLELDIGIESLTESDLDRAAQLTQRTNQFNSSTLRLTEAEVRERMRDPHGIAVRVNVADRFGDYGTVGLMLASAQADVLEADVFLLSCRALARGVEHRMLARLGERAEELGLSDVRIAFRPTERNEPVDRFLHEASGLEGSSRAQNGDLTVPSQVARAFRFDPERPVEGVASRRPTARPEGDQPARVDHTALVLQEVARELRTPHEVLNAVRGKVTDRPDLGQAYVEPRGDLERRIAEIWKDTLRVSPVGALDRFADLGGSSLALVRVHGRLLDELDVEVDITDLLQHTTVRTLASHIEGSGEDADRVDGARKRGQRSRAAMAGFRAVRSDRRSG